MILPGEKCPNINKITYFFKPIYNQNASKYIEFQEKYIKLKTLLEESKYIPNFFTGEPHQAREYVLNKLGAKMNTNMSLYDLYLTPYLTNDSFRININKFIVDKYQKINRFFNYKEYASKSGLYLNYKLLKNKFPSDYNFMFDTYLYPEDKKIIEKKFGNYTIKNNNEIWLIKPKFKSEGINITILTNISDIILEDYVLTKYLYNPHLIKGYKYDIRFHTLVSSIQPLILYLYNEGMVRFATEKYNFSESNINNKFMHLTNININNKNKIYKIPTNLTDIEESNLWNFDTFRKYCIRTNINFDRIYSEVSDIFIKLMISVKDKLSKEILQNNLENSNFYHFIALDIILDENLNPYLLEANRNGGLGIHVEALKYSAYDIVTDTLNIIGVRPRNSNNSKILKEKTELLREKIEETLCELDRPRGGYKLIFPLKNNIEKYKKFFGENISEEDNELWKNLFE